MKIAQTLILPLIVVVLLYGVSAASGLRFLSQSTPCSIQGQGFIVIIVKDLFGQHDYFKFGENDQFILGSQMRNGTGTYLALDEVYFNAQFTGILRGEAFTYNFYGFNYWGIIILGEGEYTHGSETKDISFSGINGSFFTPWFK